MKTGIFLLTGAMAVSLLGIGCNNTQKQHTAQDESNAPAIFACTDSTTMECDGIN